MHTPIRSSVHASVSESVCPPVRASETIIMFRRYLRYLSMDLLQTVVVGASWDKDELIRFGGSKGQRSRSHYCGGGVQHRDVHGSIFLNPIQSNPVFILSAKKSSNMFRNLISFVQLMLHVDHRLNGSSSPGLTATCLSYGSFCDFLTF